MEIKYLTLDPEIEDLKQEMRLLEIEITTASNEYSEVQKLLSDFSLLHNRELGDIIRRILFLRKEKLHKDSAANINKQEKYEQAKRDYEHFNCEFEKSKEKQVHQLDAEQLKELKKKYRQAALLCHPDRIAEELKNQAEEIFRQLNEAYESNDLRRVSEILALLEKGGLLISKSEAINEKLKLVSTLSQLRIKLTEWKKLLANLKTSDTWRKISDISNWDSYFAQTKVKFQAELEKLEEWKRKMQ